MGGRGNKRTEFTGRPKSDANYGPKKRFNTGSRFEGENRYNDRGPKEMQLFKATCTTCGKPCEVPFKPDGQKPVLCRDCFTSKNSSPTGNDSFKRANRDFSSRPTFKSDNRTESFRPPAPVQHSGADNAQLHKQVAIIESKLNEVLALLKNAVQEAKVADKVNPTSEVEKATKVETAKSEKPAKKGAEVKPMKVEKRDAKKSGKKAVKK